MEDKDIVALYLNRDENAIYETKIKYGHYCYSIAYNILFNNEDSQECVNDTYLHTWNGIPPHCPKILSTFIGKITRRLSIDKYRKIYADKRGAGEYTISLDEIGECIASNDNTEKEVDKKILTEKINLFLSRINKNERNVFVCRYFYFDSIEEIADRYNYSQSKVKMMLSRTREKLKVYLVKEGY